MPACRRMCCKRCVYCIRLREPELLSLCGSLGNRKADAAMKDMGTTTRKSGWLLVLLSYENIFDIVTHIGHNPASPSASTLRVQHRTSVSVLGHWHRALPVRPGTVSTRNSPRRFGSRIGGWEEGGGRAVWRFGLMTKSYTHQHLKHPMPIWNIALYLCNRWHSESQTNQYILESV